MIVQLKGYLDPLSPYQLEKNKKKQHYQILTPSDKTFWIHVCVILFEKKKQHQLSADSIIPQKSMLNIKINKGQ